MRRLVFLAVLALGAVTVVGCNDNGDTTPGDGGMTPDGGGDGGMVSMQSLPGLTGNVEVHQDERGMWHIYAENLEDAYMVQGYLMAVDRLFEMQLIRRQTRGELSEVLGNLTVEDDKDARFEGHARMAQQIWDQMDSGEQALLQAFADGVNVRIHEVVDDPDLRPPGTTLIANSYLRDWEPTDTLAIARFMTADLSLDTKNDLNNTDALEKYEAAFPTRTCDGTSPPECPAYAARAGAFHDLYPFAPALETSVIDGFPNTPGGTTTGFTALIPPAPDAPAPAAGIPSPAPSVLEAALDWANRNEARHEALLGDLMTRGSNSWVVSGSLTASGYPIMNNDPHLSLTSPPLFWYVHINTKKLGGGDMNVEGLALAGAPGVLLGYNDDLAWGMTTHGYDVTDNWLETLNDTCDGVMWDDPSDGLGNPIEVPFETVTETITVAGVDQTVEFYKTPHHGFIIPGTLDCAAKQAISVRWVGWDPSDELGAILGVNRATSIEELENAWDGFKVGGQTLVVAQRDGRIYYTSGMNLPIRESGAMTYDPATQTGVSPCFLMPGDTGTTDWNGYLDDAHIPHALDPAKGYIATANGDATGTTFDGDPLNDAYFIGCDFSDGFRVHRITERLEELKTRGDITPDDMQALQADAQSPHGRYISPAMVAELDRLEEELNAPGTHPDLTAAATAAKDAGVDTQILAMRDRLKDWADTYDFDTPAGVPDSGSEGPADASIATSIFNVAFSYLLQNTFYDEFDAMTGALDGNLTHVNGKVVRTIQWGVEGTNASHPHLTGWDDTLRGGQGDMIWWDDLSTPGVVESRGDRVARAFIDAAGKLEEIFGTTDMSQWLWGKVHTLTLESLAAAAGDPTLNIPPAGSTDFPNGFPRHGDRHVVDASNFGTFNTDSFDYGSGPQQRLVVTMTPDGPEARNAMPGGESIDVNSPHHADEIELWRKNQAPPMHFQYDDVVAHSERTITFEP